MVEPAPVEADKCPICREWFDASERFPFMLIPCTHTVC